MCLKRREFFIGLKNRVFQQNRPGAAIGYCKKWLADSAPKAAIQAVHKFGALDGKNVLGLVVD